MRPWRMLLFFSSKVAAIDLGHTEEREHRDQEWHQIPFGKFHNPVSIIVIGYSHCLALLSP